MTQARKSSTRTRQTPIQSLDDLIVWIEGAWARMTKPLDRHQGNQVILAVRAWFLEAVRTWCPEVLEDLRRTVYVPLEARVGPDDAAVLLRSPLPVDRGV